MLLSAGIIALIHFIHSLVDFPVRRLATADDPSLAPRLQQLLFSSIFSCRYRAIPPNDARLEFLLTPMAKMSLVTTDRHLTQ